MEAVLRPTYTNVYVARILYAGLIFNVESRSLCACSCGLVCVLVFAWESTTAECVHTKRIDPRQRAGHGPVQDLSDVLGGRRQSRDAVAHLRYFLPGHEAAEGVADHPGPTEIDPCPHPPIAQAFCCFRLGQAATEVSPCTRPSTETAYPYI